MTPENEEKKKYLLRYKWDMEKIDEIETEINKFRLKALPGAITYDGMPHGSLNSSDLSSYAAKIGDYLLELKIIRDRTMKELNEISNTIEKVRDTKCNILLRYRYIQLKSWNEIAVLMGYKDVRPVYRIHGLALEQIEIPHGITIF